MIRTQRTYAFAVLLLVIAGSAWAGPKLSVEEKCEAAKNKIAGQYAFCRHKAEAKAISTRTAANFAKCNAALLTRWGKAESKASKAGGTCADVVTAEQIQSVIAAHTDAVAESLRNAPLPPVCGDSVVESPETCDPPGFSATCLSLSCGTDCTCEAPAPVCGDSVVESPETCDPPGFSLTCLSLSCGVDCTCDAPLVCGDGICDASEECSAPTCGPVTLDGCCCADCGCGLSGCAAQCIFTGQDPTVQRCGVL